MPCIRRSRMSRSSGSARRKSGFVVVIADPVYLRKENRQSVRYEGPGSGASAAFFSQSKEPCGFLGDRYVFGMLDFRVNIVQDVVGALHGLQVKIGAGSGEYLLGVILRLIGHSGESLCALAAGYRNILILRAMDGEDMFCARTRTTLNAKIQGTGDRNGSGI